MGFIKHTTEVPVNRGPPYSDCFSFLGAFASIGWMRSRITEKMLATHRIESGGMLPRYRISGRALSKRHTRLVATVCTVFLMFSPRIAGPAASTIGTSAAPYQL
jgi:hypothetical protein